MLQAKESIGGGGDEIGGGSEVDSGVVLCSAGFMQCCYHAKGKLAPPVLCPWIVVG